MAGSNIHVRELVSCPRKDTEANLRVNIEDART